MKIIILLVNLFEYIQTGPIGCNNQLTGSKSDNFINVKKKYYFWNNFVVIVIYIFFFWIYIYFKKFGFYLII